MAVMQTNERGYGLGWDPERALLARGLLLQGNHAVVNPLLAIKPAISLGKHVLRDMDQKQAGTCWVHAAVYLEECLAGSEGFKAFPTCRRLVGWQGKQLEGGGNPSDGGTCTDAIMAMTTGKAGIAHEDLCPYTDDRRTLGQRPAENVWQDGKKANITVPVDVKSDDDCRKLVGEGIPVCMGEWWPSCFDDSVTFMEHIGSGGYGHAQCTIGYVQEGVFPGDRGRHAWFQVINSHGPLYPPLPSNHADHVPGYHADSDRVYHYWERADMRKALQRKGNYEYVSAVTVNGIGRNAVIPSFGDALA